MNTANNIINNIASVTKISVSLKQTGRVTPFVLPGQEMKFGCLVKFANDWYSKLLEISDLIKLNLGFSSSRIGMTNSDCKNLSTNSAISAKKAKL